MITLHMNVHDMLIFVQDMIRICKFKDEFTKAFVMKDLGYARKILGMQVVNDRK